jgi:hypothetical protein
MNGWDRSLAANRFMPPQRTDLLGELKRGLLFVRGEKVTPVSAKDRKKKSSPHFVDSRSLRG